MSAQAGPQAAQRRGTVWAWWLRGWCQHRRQAGKHLGKNLKVKTDNMSATGNVVEAKTAYYYSL